jgi:iron complex transport system substrate-binding protein
MARHFRWLGVLASLLPLAAFAATPARVLSLGGDITETVYALGAQPSLVGVDTTSEFPTAAQRLPNVGYVRQLAAEGILALHPDLVIATHDAGPPPVLEQLRSAGVRIALLPTTRTPQAVLDKVRRVGELLDRPAAATALSARLAHDYQTLAERVAAMPRHPRVAFLMATGAGSAMIAGRETAAAAALALAGGISVGAGFVGYKPVSAEALAALAPDAIVVMSARDTVGNDRIADTLQIPGVAMTPAGRERHIRFVDGQALLGFGPRNAEQERALQRWLEAL